MSGKTKRATKATKGRRKSGKNGITKGVYGVGRGMRNGAYGVRNGVYGVGKGVRNGIYGVGKGVYGVGKGMFNVGRGVTRKFVGGIKKVSH